jgi:hypothetical protein
MALAVLLVGLAASAVVYLTSDEGTSDVLTYEQSASGSYGLSPEDSKIYTREMEQVGGRLNMIAYRFRLWLSGIWHGRSLEYTIALFSILVALALRLFSRASDKEDRLGKDEKPQA